MSLRPKDMTDGDEKQLAVDCALFFGDNSIKELEFYSPLSETLASIGSMKYHQRINYNYDIQKQRQSLI